MALKVGEGHFAELLTFAVEFVGQPLQEQHAEDGLPELRGVHLAAQDIGLCEQQLEFALFLFQRIQQVVAAQFLARESIKGFVVA